MAGCGGCIRGASLGPSPLTRRALTAQQAPLLAPEPRQQRRQRHGLRRPQLHGPAPGCLGPRALPRRSGWTVSSAHRCNPRLHLRRTDLAPGRGGEGPEPASLPSAPRDVTAGRAVPPAGPPPLPPRALGARHPARPGQRAEALRRARGRGKPAWLL